MTTSALATETHALGTTARIVVDGAAAEDALAIMVEELELVEQACSRFRDDSDLSRVNRESGRTVRVSPLLLEALEVALRAARVTDGCVDPTIGSALVLLGYDRDFVALPKSLAPRVVRARRVPGWQGVVVDTIRATLRIPAGVQLDLGATAKAWAADRAARRVAADLDCGVLVSLGGDIAVAGPAPEAGWPVRVSDDHRAGLDAPGQTISVISGGIATSSVTVRRWSQGTEIRHHLIDPSTGLPATGPFRTASVAAASCADANIASTAALVLGAAAPGWLDARHLPARLTGHDGGVVIVAGWPVPGSKL